MREASFLEHTGGERGTHAVHGGQDDAQVCARGGVTGGQLDGLSDVFVARVHGLDQVVVHGHLVGGGRGLDGRGDLGIEGRDDLDALPVARDDAPAQVDLVAVVGCWVVRGGDHDARVRAEVAHREGGERGRVGLGQREDAHACCRGDTASGRGELGGAVAGVAADNQSGGAGGVSLDDLAQASGRADDNGQVHAEFAGTHDTSQTRGAELEGAVHGGSHARQGFAVAAARGLDISLQGRGRGRIRVVVRPALGFVEQFHCSVLQSCQDGVGCGDAQAGGSGIDHGERRFGVANTARGLDAQGIADGGAHKRNRVGRSTTGGVEARRGLHEVSTSGLRSHAGGDDLVVAQGGRFDDDLEDARGGDDAAHRRDLLSQLVQSGVLDQLDVDDHVDLVSSVGDGLSGLERLDLRFNSTGGEAHNASDLQALGHVQGQHRGRDAHGVRACRGSFFDDAFHVRLGGLGLENRVVDHRGHVALLHRSPFVSSQSLASGRASSIMAVKAV